MFVALSFRYRTTFFYYKVSGSECYFHGKPVYVGTAFYRYFSLVLHFDNHSEGSKHCW